MDLSKVIGRVRESNLQARGARARWASHRANVMRIVRRIPSTGRRIALLGAGHLHDVELDELMRRYEHVTLVDLDAETVLATVAEYPHAAAQCTIHAPVDLTGLFDVLPLMGCNEDGLNRAIALMTNHRCAVAGAPFDLTVSLGVLTQLLQAVIDVGFDAEDIPRASLIVRDKHLNDLLRLTRPGGTIVIVTDIVSTASAPELAQIPKEHLEFHLAQLVAAGNFFTGTNPYRIIALLQSAHRAEVARARFIGPWLWPVTSDRQHLTGAIVVRKRS